jgi:hypothetical protein
VHSYLALKGQERKECHIRLNKSARSLVPIFYRSFVIIIFFSIQLESHVPVDKLHGRAKDRIAHKSLQLTCSPAA